MRGPLWRRRKRGRGWDDWEEQAQKAAAEASAQNAHLMSLGCIGLPKNVHAVPCRTSSGGPEGT